MVAEQTDKRIYDYGTVDTYPADLYNYHGLAEGVNHFEDITAEHIAQFQTQGYLVIQQAFTPAEVQAALDGLLHLISGQNTDFKGVMYEHKAADFSVETMPAEEKQDYIRKFMGYVNHDERLKALSEHPQLIALLTRLLGDTPFLFQDMALLKPPQIGREKPWHQDHAYFNLGLDITVAGAWIALDEATPENGCMIVKPGSHTQGPIVHFQRRDWQICDTDINNQGAIAVPLKPGGCLLFHSLIHHGTPTNHSTHRRRALQFHYRPQSAPQTNVEERLAIFGAEGKNVTC